MGHARQAACLVLGCLLWALTGQATADHESAETILSQWEKWASRRQEAPAASPVRVLPVGPQASAGLTAAARAFAANAFSLVILERGAVVFEAYAQGAHRESRLNAYSMTKSMTALAVGEALCAGKLPNLDTAAKTHAPELAGTAYGEASIRQLLAYTSGAQDPGGDGYAGIHDGRDFGALLRQQMSLVDLMKKYGAQQVPAGEKFIYNGLDSEALSVVLRHATERPLAQWFGETVWKHAGAEYSAAWFADRDGNSVAEVALLATTRDYARVGQYVLERLTAQSRDACMNAFVQDAAAPHSRKPYWKSAPQFGLGLHVGADGHTWIMGHGGQRIGINTKNGRVVATNAARQWRGYDDEVQRLLSY